jgi:hypothetical protein
MINSIDCDKRLARDILAARTSLRSVVLGAPGFELPAWLTADVDTCERCGGEKVWMHKPFDSDEWLPGNGFGTCSGGQGYHGCLSCNGPL